VDDEDEEEVEKEDLSTHVTRPGVGHGIHLQLGKSERSGNGVDLSTGSSAASGKWYHTLTVEGDTRGDFERHR
jgi:hypothetical protein